MISNLAGILIILSIFGIVVSVPGRAVDCRKFVFAPPCRGVAAKRDSSFPKNYDTDALFKEEGMKYLLNYLHLDPILLGEVRSTGKSASKQSESFTEPFQGRMNPILRLLFETRNNSERDYSPRQEFDNMQSIRSL